MVESSEKQQNLCVSALEIALFAEESYNAFENIFQNIAAVFENSVDDVDKVAHSVVRADAVGCDAAAPGGH